MSEGIEALIVTGIVAAYGRELRSGVGAPYQLVRSRLPE